MEEYEVDLRDYFRVMWRKKWIILGVFLAAVVVALLFSFRMPSRYEAEALVRLNDLPQIARIQVQSPSPQIALVILSSRDLLIRTATEAKLTEEEPF
ncbi:MAG: Wzz/FepE/Etk N-terminal domain-containing protein, partial [Candidatus Bipolaricaulia bacterium]